MEAVGEQDSSSKTVKAAPITAVIAARVKALRTEARLSGPALASKLNGLGVPWNRTTIAKFETGARHSITVQELLALALALRVPPAMLLADPRHVSDVTLAVGAEGAEGTEGAEGVVVPAWDALLWLVGRGEITVEGATAVGPADAGNDVMKIIHCGWELAEATSELSISEVWSRGGEEADLLEVDRRNSARWKAALRRINRALSRLRSMGVPEPDLHPSVRERAQELYFPLLPDSNSGLTGAHVAPSRVVRGAED